jgi:hypothetical protein
MAQPSNTFSTYDAIGIREDLTDVIYNVDPTETPFFQMAAKNKATNTFHEWQTDTLAAASSSNQVIEGNDTTVAASSPTVRLGNYCEIAEKSARISGTEESVTKAGRNNEMAYQVVKRTKELRRDMESSLLANKVRNAGSDTVARQLAGVPVWYTSNTDAGSGGSDGDGLGTTARTDGTQRAFTEDQLKTVLASAWDNGGDPDCIMVGSFNKQKISGFTGGSTRFDKSEDKKLIAAIDVYVSDFGDLKVIPNRFQRARDAHILQKDMWAVSFLRPVKNKALAITGDSEARLINTEFTMESRNQQASGLVADLTTS